ncbi:M48 family metallopeptidase [Natronosporangium hydrolyticum]|uniref:M48 family metallopeptidase n=1 Tax=Natronosporangium hydrolyticum TaxID=2811111 RepID=A0A895YFJ2_9ACTN|nr:M48 family metallopeptidase [Natronosporangium hydrolyticum]QSB12950.1 M48 family metallopeptidase [Natronosporangium hydrolyticum]
MNFFERQQQVKRMSGRLVLLFALAVVGIVATINLVALMLFGGFDQPAGDIIGIVVTVSLLVLALIAGASLFKMLSLRSGGGAHVARSLGAKPVPEDTRDPQLRRYRNVVEEIAIASGVPVPELFVMEGEPGINAFAAGWSPSDAAVAVTRGALEQLNRDELQGVIGHEFSHVVNGDMRLNIRLMGLLFGILVLAFVGRILLHVRGGQRNPVPLIGLAMLAVGFIGLFIGRIIKAAVSRQREYLADASAVQFTRQTAGLTGALKKIAGIPAGSNLRNAKSEDVSHMLFGSGKGLSGMLATHPPILKRIQALDPTITEQELAQLRQRYAQAPPSGAQEDRAMGLTGGGSLPPAESTMKTAPQAVSASVGTPTENSYAQAGTILQQIPAEFLTQAHDSAQVVPLVFGLLMSSQHEVRVNQHSALVARHGQQLADAAWQAGSSLTSLHPMLRLPLAQVAFPALRHRNPQEQQVITGSVEALIQADGRLSVSEYCLSRLLHEELYEAAHRQPSWGRRRYSLSASRTGSATMLATLAQAGHEDPAAAQRAFQAGAERLFPGQRLPYAPPQEGVRSLESVWPALDGLNPADKELLVQAMVDVVSHDGALTVAEAELLRTICAMLHCPLPPMITSLSERPRPVSPDQA